MMSKLLSVFLVWIYFQIFLINSIDIDDIDDLRIELRDEFDSSGKYLPLLSATVRLIFHDCSGPGEDNKHTIAQCNGCIDFQNSDHAGLEDRAVRPLQQIYESSWKNKMSRADFWAGMSYHNYTYIRILCIYAVYIGYDPRGKRSTSCCRA